MIYGMALCAGVGMLEAAVKVALGDRYRTLLYVEREAHAAAVLTARMEDGSLDTAPIWDDLTTLDCRRWRGRISFVSAGFPCQPASLAGKRLGTDDERWIWPDIARIIREVEPGVGVFLENVPGLLSANDGAAFGEVLGDLAALGFDAEWGVLSAAAVGAPHKRERVFILAHHHDAGRRILWSGRLLDRERSAFGNDADGSGSAAVAHAECGAGQSADGRAVQRGRADDAQQVGLGCGTMADASMRGRGTAERDADAGRGEPDAAGSGTFAVAHPSRERWGEGWPESAREQWRPDAPECGCAVGDPAGVLVPGQPPAGSGEAGSASQAVALPEGGGCCGDVRERSATEGPPRGRGRLRLCNGRRRDGSFCNARCTGDGYGRSLGYCRHHVANPCDLPGDVSPSGPPDGTNGRTATRAGCAGSAGGVRKVSATSSNAADFCNCISCMESHDMAYERSPEAKARRREEHRLRWQRIRREVITHYSNGTPSCACCGESEYQFLALDHINGRGSEERKQYRSGGGTSKMFWRDLQRDGYPEGYQVLCHNCNCAKHYYGECPHKRSLADADLSGLEGRSRLSGDDGEKRTTPERGCDLPLFPPGPGDAEAWKRTPPTSSRPQLNPRFVDWLMALPPGWTACAPLETASWYRRLRLHCMRLLRAWGYA